MRRSGRTFRTCLRVLLSCSESEESTIVYYVVHDERFKNDALKSLYHLADSCLSNIEVHRNSKELILPGDRRIKVVTFRDLNRDHRNLNELNLFEDHHAY